MASRSNPKWVGFSLILFIISRYLLSFLCFDPLSLSLSSFSISLFLSFFLLSSFFFLFLSFVLSFFLLFSFLFFSCVRFNWYRLLSISLADLNICCFVLSLGSKSRFQHMESLRVRIEPISLSFFHFLSFSALLPLLSLFLLLFSSLSPLSLLLFSSLFLSLIVHCCSTSLKPPP